MSGDDRHSADRRADSLDELRRSVDDLTAHTMQQFRQHEHHIQEHGGILAERAPQADEHTTSLAELRADVNMLLEQQPPAEQFPPVCWPTLPAEDLAAEWDNLAAWVRDVLVNWYHPSRQTLPDCWPLHPGALVELSALERLWQQSYARRASAIAAAEWHTRWRGDLLGGVRAAIDREASTGPEQQQVQCGPGHHLGQPLPGTERAQQPSPQPQQQPAGSAGADMPPAPGIPAGRHPAALAQMASPPRPNSDGSVNVPNEAQRLAEARFWWPHYQTARDRMVAARREQEHPPPGDASP